MNPQATSKQAILAACRDIVRHDGLQGISIRSAAAASNVAPGTLYHYFPNKESLLVEVTADVWADIFGTHDPANSALGLVDAGHDAACELGEHPFEKCVRSTYAKASAGLARYPGFLTGHQLDLTKLSVADGPDSENVGTANGATVQGKKRMKSFFQEIQEGFLQVLSADDDVLDGVFNEDFSPSDFVGLVTREFLLSLVLGQKDCETLLAVVHRTLYV